MNFYVIYKTTCIVNGKYYIGQHCRDSDNYLGSGKILKRAFKKYGKHKFVKEILEYCTKDDANAREIYWIAKLNARDTNIGYNLDRGGHGTAGHKTDYSGVNNPNYGNGDKIRGDKNPSKKQYVREKISKKLKGIKKSEESKIRNRNSHLGIKPSKNSVLKRIRTITGSFHNGLYVYLAVSPKGINYCSIKSLGEFCKNNNLNEGCVRASIRYNRKYFGWCFTRKLKKKECVC